MYHAACRASSERGRRWGLAKSATPLEPAAPCPLVRRGRAFCRRGAPPRADTLRWPGNRRDGPRSPKDPPPMRHTRRLLSLLLLTPLLLALGAAPEPETDPKPEIDPKRVVLGASRLKRLRDRPEPDAAGGWAQGGENSDAVRPIG